MFKTLLIANRGEIACRIAASARRLGIRTVAVYSDADKHAPHVSACDGAVHIGGAEPQHSYLNTAHILHAAREMHVDAVHPGYGFLSENHSFAQSVTDAGLIFVGPPASAIASMGNKAAAKALMKQAGVPVIPGYHDDNQDPVFLKERAHEIGYPIIIKAHAGGGGKGMRVVEDATSFFDALASCQREALSSFGDSNVLIERYVQKPRHIEIQVFLDRNGNAVSLFERDCSMQRRHQKVLEEAPAPGMTTLQRNKMGEAAIAAARAVGYVGAGTVEFIVTSDEQFYFMEMNTRLQVEHPVTEMITGLDLVEWQLRVAAGQSLPKKQEELHINGHAIEARIYAENPRTGFLPSTGLIRYLKLPEHAAFTCATVRIDKGIEEGDTITPHYDPLIAKLIVHGTTRDEARAQLRQALAQTRIVGIHTNVEFLSNLVQDDAFAHAEIDTGFIERRMETLLPAARSTNITTLALASAAVMIRQGTSCIPEDIPSQPPQHDHFTDPWSIHDGWRVTGSYQQTLVWKDQNTTHYVVLTHHSSGWQLNVDNVSYAFCWTGASKDNTKHIYDVHSSVDNQTYTGTVFFNEKRAYLFHQGRTESLHLHDASDHLSTTQTDQHGRLTSPMPGKIISLAIGVGDTVCEGQVMLTIEAMKMEHTIAAPYGGTVENIFFKEGDYVGEGVQLITITA